MRAEREQRQSLQRSLQREQDNSVELRTQLQQLQGLHEVSGAVRRGRGHAGKRRALCSLWSDGTGAAESEGGEAAAAAEV